MADQELLTAEETAERLRVSADTLRYWRFRGKAPVGFRVGRRVVYRASDVEAFIAELADGARGGREVIRNAPFRDRCPMCSAEPVARDRMPFITVEVVEHSFDCPWLAANADRVRTERAALAILTALVERSS